MFTDAANTPLSLKNARYVKQRNDNYTASTQVSVVPVLLKTDGTGGLAQAVAVISVWSDIDFIEPSS
ncbi:hypothetical protein KS18_13130 [Photorhabdus luminescens]|nr:hypothetical protein KS18_13130 [Photorhabdus luminescens]